MKKKKNNGKKRKEKATKATHIHFEIRREGCVLCSRVVVLFTGKKGRKKTLHIKKEKMNKSGAIFLVHILQMKKEIYSLDCREIH
jgi:hypothetical protein